jgi:hypothetical protein
VGEEVHNKAPQIAKNRGSDRSEAGAPVVMLAVIEADEVTIFCVVPNLSTGDWSCDLPN